MPNRYVLRGQTCENPAIGNIRLCSVSAFWLSAW